MASPVDFKVFRRKFKRFGIAMERGKKHWRLEGRVDGVRVVYPFAVRKNKVEACYVKAARKAFHLTEDYGISGRDWERA